MITGVAKLKTRRVVAIITIERDERDDYHASTSFDGEAIDSGPWFTLLACLDGTGRRLLERWMRHKCGPDGSTITPRKA